MTMDDKVRMFTRNPLIPIAVILLGSVWFALSIFSFFVGLLIPWAILRMPPAARRRSRGSSPASSVAAVSEPLMSNSGDQPMQHRVTFPDTPADAVTRSRTAKRRSSSAGPPDTDTPKYRLSTYAIVLDSTTTLVEDPSSHRQSSESTKSESPTGSLVGHNGDGSVESSVSCSRRGSLSSSNRKLPLAARFTGMRVFRSRSVKRGRDSLSRSGSIASSSSSTPRSLTPPPSPPKRDDEYKTDRGYKTDKGESSSRGDAIRSAISAPFKFRPKRASASATMSTAYVEKVSLYASTTTVEAPADEPTEPTTQTPSPPPSPTDETPSAVTPTQRTRRKPFTAYLNLALSSEVATSITSPRRRNSVSSSSANSGPSHPQQPRILSILSPTASSGFKSPKTPKTPVPAARTQPYGAPYFAQMPTGEYAYDEKTRRDYARRRHQERKASGSASDVPRSAGVRRFSRDTGDEDRVSPRTAKPPPSSFVATSGEPQAQVASRRRRGSGHRRDISDGVMTS